MRGRKPKPDKLKRLTGDPGKRLAAARRATAAAESPAGSKAPEPPADLTPEAAAEFRRLVELLAPHGKITQLDVAALAAHCQAWAFYCAELRKIQQSGTVVTIRDDKGVIKAMNVSPHVNVAMKMLEKLRAFGNDLGLSPSARGALVGGGGDGKSGPGSALEEYLKRKADRK